MESQPQNPEFRINPENFHPCIYQRITELISQMMISTISVLEVFILANSADLDKMPHYAAYM